MGGGAMTQAIRDVHTALATLVEGLSITDPVTLAMGAVWPYVPPARQVIIPPAAVITHNLTNCEFGTNGTVIHKYDMHVQLFAAEAAAVLDEGADVANAFLDELITAISAQITLGGAVQVVQNVRGAGGAGTLVLLTWGTKTFVGLDVVIPITLLDTRERGA